MNKWARMALEIARNGEFPGHRLGCVILTKGGVVVAQNTLKTHPLSAKAKASQKSSSGRMRRGCCAEVAAIAKAISKYGEESLKGAELYVARCDKKGEPRVAKPCLDCTDIIHAMKIKKTWWTDTDPAILLKKSEIKPRVNHADLVKAS